MHLRIMFGFQVLKQYRQNQFIGDGTAGQLYFFNNRRQQIFCPATPATESIVEEVIGYSVLMFTLLIKSLLSHLLPALPL